MFTLSLVAWPLVTAILLFVVPPRWIRAAAFAGAVVEFILLLMVFVHYDSMTPADIEVNYSWIPALGANFHLGMDGISILLVFLTTLLTPFIILSSSDRPYERTTSFYALIMLMEMALVGVFTALDGFLFYVFWELALIPIYFICLRWGGENRVAITLKFFIYTLAGSLLMLAALIYVYLQTPGAHSFDIRSLYAAGQQLPVSAQGLVFWAMFLAFAIKMPVVPFHTWQPETYNAAPAQGTMLLSGIMLKMGIYGVIRWLLPLAPAGILEWGMTAMILSVAGIVYASCIAIIQKDLKKLIAWSSIAHVGLISAGIFTISQTGLSGAMIQMISHGIVVVMLFFLVDIVMMRTNTQSMEELGGIRTVAPRFSTVFIIVLLAAIALPMTSGFVGEFLLISSLFRFNMIIGSVAGLTVILGAVYMLRGAQQTMLGDTGKATEGFMDLTFREKAVLYPLTVVVIAIGVYPAPLLQVADRAAADLLTLLSDYYTLNRP